MYIRPRKAIGALPLELTSTILNCNRCPLHKYRTKVVIGRGSIPAKILFLGEAPGKSENVVGIPFFGISGKFLDEIILDAMKLAGVDNMPPYYITNSVLCRPTDKIGGNNREPKPEEIAMCMPFVNEIVRFVNPKIVIFVGDVAHKYYKKEFTNTAKIYHPAFLIRKGGKGCVHYSPTIRTIADIIKGV